MARARRRPHDLGGLAPEPPATRTIQRSVLSEIDSLELLGTAGLPIVQTIRVETAEAAVAAAATLGYPVVLKADATGLAHKSEIGGVRVRLADASAVDEAARELLALPLPAEATRSGLLVAPMISDGVQLIVGMERDEQFGPAVLVGLGGVLAEVLDDVAIRLAPVPGPAAREMLDELRASPLLYGYRGEPAVDLDGVRRLIVAIGQLAVDRTDIAEIDLNPVIAGPDGATIVDALVVLDG